MELTIEEKSDWNIIQKDKNGIYQYKVTNLNIFEKINKFIIKILNKL